MPRKAESKGKQPKAKAAGSKRKAAGETVSNPSPTAGNSPDRVHDWTQNVRRSINDSLVTDREDEASTREPSAKRQRTSGDFALNMDLHDLKGYVNLTVAEIQDLSGQVAGCRKDMSRVDKSVYSMNYTVEGTSELVNCISESAERVETDLSNVRTEIEDIKGLVEGDDGLGFQSKLEELRGEAFEIGHGVIITKKDVKDLKRYIHGDEGLQAATVGLQVKVDQIKQAVDDCADDAVCAVTDTREVVEQVQGTVNKLEQSVDEIKNGMKILTSKVNAVIRRLDDSDWLHDNDTMVKIAGTGDKLDDVMEALARIESKAPVVVYGYAPPPPNYGPMGYGAIPPPPPPR